jgi:GxxExxY protein
MTESFNKLTEAVIGAAMEVHRLLGPGLLESAYQKALEHELELRHISFESQRACPVSYKGIDLGEAYRIDLLIDGALVVEIKSVDEIANVHEAQLLTYLRFSRCPIGLIFNFRKPLLKDGIRRFSL